MLKGKTVLVVVPARGGSKGVTLKNIQPLMGMPLVAHTGELVRRLGYVDKAVVSTDHPQIAAVARDSGLEAPFYRPEDISGDRIGDFPVLRHALLASESTFQARYDVVVMLQPTCPLRTEAHVTATIEHLIDGQWDAVWTVSPTDLKYHPLKTLVVGADGGLRLFDERGKVIVARQQLEPIYHRNGAAYAFSRDCILNGNTTLPAHSSAVVVHEPLVSIDTLADFATVEAIMRGSAALPGKAG